MKDPIRAALERMQTKLLDLSSRNRLLNFSVNRKSILRFVDSPLNDVYTKIYENPGKNSFLIAPLPEPGSNDFLQDGKKRVRPRELDWARKQGISISYENAIESESRLKLRLQTILYKEEYTTRARSIASHARLAIEETGSNMLYLIFGFLEHPDKVQEDKRYLAPLISMPVSIERRVTNDSYRYYIGYTGDDISSNLPLIEKLKVDYGIVLPEFDDDKYNVESYFKRISQAISKHEEFRLLPTLTLGVIANYTDTLLIRDIEPSSWGYSRNNKLLKHPIVRMMLGESDQSSAVVEQQNAINDDFDDEDDDVCDVEIDNADDAYVDADTDDELPLVFDADSSQLAAIHSVVNRGKNVVVSGPPGTGKSQTIANMIAALLHRGKKVLFVADKMAALEVVKSRLEKVELGHFLLSLHGNKINKKEVLDSLAARIDFKRRRDKAVDDEEKEHGKVRAKLDSYVHALHSNPESNEAQSLFTYVWKRELLLRQLGLQPRHLEIPHTYLTTSADKIDVARDYLVELQRSFTDLNRDAYQQDLRTIDSHVESAEDVPVLLSLIETYEGLVARNAELQLRLKALTSLSDERLLAIGSKLVEALREILRHVRDDQQLSDILLLRKTGVSSKRCLQLADDLKEQVDRYHSATKTRDEIVANNAVEMLLKSSDIDAFQRHIAILVADDTSLAGLERWGRSVQEICTNVISTHEELYASIKAIGLRRNICENDFNQFEDLLSILQGITPENLRYHDTRRHTSERREHLETVLRIRRANEQLEKHIQQRYYVDKLPSAYVLEEARATLMKGYTWYRRFDRNWRNAIALAQSCARYDTSSYFDSLTALTEMIEYLQVKQEYRQQKIWGIIDFDPTMPIEQLDKQLQWIRWYEATSMELLSIGVTPEAILDGDGTAVINRVRRILAIEDQIASSRKAISTFKEKKLYEVARRLELSSLPVDEQAKQILTFSGRLVQLSVALQESFGTSVSLQQLLTARTAHQSVLFLEKHFSHSGDYRSAFLHLYKGLQTDTRYIVQIMSVSEGISAYSDVLPIDTVLQASTTTSAILHVIDSIQGVLDLRGTIHNIIARIESFIKLPYSASKYGAGRYSLIVTYANQLVALARFQQCKQEHPELLTELKALVQLIEQGELDGIDVGLLYEYYLVNSTIRKLISHKSIKGLTKGVIQESHERFKELDRSIIQRRGRDIAARLLLSSRPPAGTGGSRVDEKTDMHLINYLIPQTRPRIPIRKLLLNAGFAVQELKPCFMMSPQAVAQYLVPGELEFDVLIIDEASQVRPEEAIGSIARARQTVIVGDNQQLPPTSFFMKHGIEDEDEEMAVDATSVLTLAESHFTTAKSLDWHYRSRHESLIQFSNSAFYRDKLVILPSPHASNDNLGIFVHYVASARYDNSMNAAEAEQIMDIVAQQIKSQPEKSIGIVTLNKKQAELIQRVFEEQLADRPAIAKYLKVWEDAGAPLFIKNLENVQGDERDIIVISTTYGPSKDDGKISQNFGPISKSGGEKRLNVLFTRAKEKVVLVTSLRPEDITLTPTTPLGTRTLRSYLEYARTPIGTGDIDGDDDVMRDEFVEHLQQRLSQNGYMCTPYYGVSAHRIDLVVRAADNPDHILAAIETDGYSYAGAQHARDRERIREDVLLNLGWQGRLLRMWTIDWLLDRDAELERILRELKRLQDTVLPVETSSVERWRTIGSSSETAPATQLREAKAVIEPSNIAASAGVVAEELVEEEQTLRVSYGDTVCYIDVELPADELMIQIVRSGEKDSPDAGIFNINRPIARVLYDHAIGDEVNLHFPGKKTKVFRILDIKKYG